MEIKFSKDEARLVSSDRGTSYCRSCRNPCQWLSRLFGYFKLRMGVRKYEKMSTILRVVSVSGASIMKYARGLS